MQLKIISLILGITVGMGFFIFNEYSKKKLIEEEINKINTNTIKTIEDKKQKELNLFIEKEKEKILQSIGKINKKNDKKIIIYDDMNSFKNFYNTALLDTKFYEKTKSADFQKSNEYKIIENIKTKLLKSRIIINGKASEIMLGIPKTLTCEKIKAPCIKNSIDNIFFDKNEIFIISGNKTFTKKDVNEILEGKKEF